MRVDEIDLEAILAPVDPFDDRPCPAPAGDISGERTKVRPMRLALLTDLHANLEALEAVLEHASRRGTEQLAFLGNLVGYGADPGPVVNRVQAAVATGALAIKGNHDEAATRGPPLRDAGQRRPGGDLDP